MCREVDVLIKNMEAWRPELARLLRANKASLSRCYTGDVDSMSAAILRLIPWGHPCWRGSNAIWTETYRQALHEKPPYNESSIFTWREES